MQQNVIKYFDDNSHIGIIENADKEIFIEHSDTNNKAKIYILLEKDIIKKIRYKVLGSSFAMATLAYLAQRFEGQTIESLKKYNFQAFLQSQEFGNIPEVRYPCVEHFIITFQKEIIHTYES
jgi:NifU-like protein involved in Fe-S cluster formation